MIELRQELARASAMLDVRRYAEASALLARIVAAEPDSARAWCLMARAHLGADRYGDAIDAANRAVALSPSDEWPHRLASNALGHLGHQADALRAAYEARRLASGYWQTHVCVAQAALAARRLDVAAEAADRARALAPNEADVHFLAGKVSLARGRLTEARAHQERAIALDPAHSGAMNELGRIRLRRHDTAGAIRHFISAARATPDERIYSRNIDVVMLRAVSRTIYVFTLIALVLIWIPAISHVSRVPFLIGLGALGAVTVGCFGWMMLRAAAGSAADAAQDPACPAGRDGGRTGRGRGGGGVRHSGIHAHRWVAAGAADRLRHHVRRSDGRLRRAALRREALSSAGSSAVRVGSAAGAASGWSGSPVRQRTARTAGSARTAALLSRP